LTRTRIVLGLPGLLAAVAACGHEAPPARSPASLSLSSRAFEAGQPIPPRFTADGEDRSPPLAWAAPPAGTVELALVCHDPDAPRPGGWTHWVLTGIPPTLRELPEGVAAGERPGNVPGAIAGKNDFGRFGWGGPSPPRGHGPHHYHFVLYALDRPTGLSPGASLRDLERAIEGHVLGRGELIGTYERR